MGRINSWVIFMLIAVSLLYSNLATAAPPQTSQACPNCDEQVNRLLLNISELNQNITNLTFERNYYKNLSEYYEGLYLNHTENITIGQIILLTENMQILNQNVTNLKEEINKKITIFSLEVGFSILSISAIAVTIIEFLLNHKKKNKQNGNKSSE